MEQLKLEPETARVELQPGEGVERGAVGDNGAQIADDRGHCLEQTVSKARTHR
jgi:hypothetical protein